MLDWRRQGDSVRGQDSVVLRRRLVGWGQGDPVGSLHAVELRGRLMWRRQWHTIRSVSVSPANCAGEPAVDRNSDGKYDKTY
jgi:hypothetical protein